MKHILLILLLLPFSALSQISITDSITYVVYQEPGVKRTYIKSDLDTKMEGGRLYLLNKEQTIRSFSNVNQVKSPVAKTLTELQDKIQAMLITGVGGTIPDSLAAIRNELDKKLPKVDTVGKWMPRGWRSRWETILNKPTFADVALSGDYDDLLNKPAELDPTVPTYAKSLTSAAQIKQVTDPLYATIAQGTLANTALQPNGNGSNLTGLTKSQVGLSNVDNTSDANKPISAATAAALATKLSSEVDGSVINEIQTLSRSGASISISSGNTITLPSAKRIETYSGVTNASGVYTVTFTTAYATPPNIQASITNQTNVQQQVRVTSVTTTGFTVNVFQRNTLVQGVGVELLIATVTNVSGQAVDVLVTEK